jgi:hypothetical protein
MRPIRLLSLSLGCAVALLSACGESELDQRCRSIKAHLQQCRAIPDDAECTPSLAANAEAIISSRCDALSLGKSDWWALDGCDPGYERCSLIFCCPSLPPTINRIVVDKSAHRLEAWFNDTLARRYSVAIGKGGLGPKRMQGDGKTPEGSYHIAGKHHSAEFHRFMLISYPNSADVQAFKQAKARGEIPANASIGGDVGIHGLSGWTSNLPHKLVDWTAGCIALDNDEVDELYARVPIGAAVQITR